MTDDEPVMKLAEDVLNANIKFVMQSVESFEGFHRWIILDRLSKALALRAQELVRSGAVVAA